MKLQPLQIPIDKETSVSGVLGIPEGFDPKTGTAVILAHGAANDMMSPIISSTHEKLAEKGYLCLKFNFPYGELGKTNPDPVDVLKKTYLAAVQLVAQHPKYAPRSLYLGGKSLGGRIASILVAEGTKADGLIFLGFPLHPPGKPDKKRDDLLNKVDRPMLFIEGTNDPLCNLDRLQEVLNSLSSKTSIHEIEGGDHSFKVPKSAGRQMEEIYTEISKSICEWLDRQEDDDQTAAV